MTNGDTLVTGAGGGKGIMIMVTDYSNGNDMIVGKPGIKSIKALKGKKVGLEVGLVDHLLLLDGLKKNGMSPKDVTLVNSKTNEMPQVLASGQVDAIGAWQPISGQAMKSLPGSRPIWTSAQAPGLIYDVLAVNPTKLASHKDDWIKLIKVWDRVVKYINDPEDTSRCAEDHVGARRADAGGLQAAAEGHPADRLLKGRRCSRKARVSARCTARRKIADDFNVANAVYKNIAGRQQLHRCRR